MPNSPHHRTRSRPAAGRTGGRAAGSPSPTGPRAAVGRSHASGRCYVIAASVVIIVTSVAMTATLIPSARPARHPGVPTAAIAPIGKPRPELRDELRRIPTCATSSTWSCSTRSPIGDHRGDGVARQRRRLGRGVPRDGSDPRPLQHPHARGRAPAAVRQPARQRLRRASGSSATRRSSPIDLYRRGHMAHHREEFGPNEPDIPLYRGYPIPRDSMRRKLTRDALGITGWKLTRGLFRGVRRRERQGPRSRRGASSRPSS